MKKWLAYVLGVLGLLVVNSLVTGATVLALFLLIGGDPILAAVLGVLVLPGIVLQPWFLVFLPMPSPFVVAPLLTTVITVFVYGWLNANGTLDRPKQALSKLGTRRVLAAVGGFLILVTGVGVARYIDFPASRHGAPPKINVFNWDVDDSRYYCLGEFIDSEWLWQARVSEPDLARLVDHFKLEGFDREKIPDEFRSMPPYWWRPSTTNQTKVLSTPDFPMSERGQDGFHVMATWSPDDQLLHVWIKDNF